MRETTADSSNQLKRGEVRIDRLLGRPVLAGNNQSVGRLEEVRTETRGPGLIVTEYVIGASGLLERLGIGMKLLFGRRSSSYVARWDQVDLHDPERPRLLCAAGDLRRT
jgi:hypothetical protein